MASGDMGSIMPSSNLPDDAKVYICFHCLKNVLTDNQPLASNKQITGMTFQYCTIHHLVTIGIHREVIGNCAITTIILKHYHHKQPPPDCHHHYCNPTTTTPTLHYRPQPPTTSSKPAFFTTMEKPINNGAGSAK
ncbi:hypothetical protein HELRODRAFT_163363 [Helobdella robusta]|uniref:Uncharacterized protein n=1 Tax=Helobdella robusta TaxID=6412 RepID=T1ETY3_HELRO|nr:hypothetical protein HELRODRAFT_163363 [Helobdella robusta]ESN96313.1 hypothetical protein HELRODRAFT_163363 [Helobdella robusta]